MSRVFLPVTVFLSVVAVHCAWVSFSPQEHPAGQESTPTAESCCGACPSTLDCGAPTVSPFPLQQYLATQDYWLGLSYGMSLAFAVVTFRRYRDERRCADRNLALGGATFSGLLAVAGCYLLGCCGSPMLAVYLSLFGAAFLSVVKPLVAALTGVSLLATWWWTTRRGHPAATAVSGAATPATTGCCCD